MQRPFAKSKNLINKLFKDSKCWKIMTKRLDDNNWEITFFLRNGESVKGLGYHDPFATIIEVNTKEGKRVFRKWNDSDNWREL